MNFEIAALNNIKYIERYIDQLEKKQLPFATSLALNKIALLSQEHICKSIPRIFNNSKKWWDKRQRTGIKVQFANKYLLSSSVYCKAYFVSIQEEGGIKKPYLGSTIAVPTPNVVRKDRSSKSLRKEDGNRTIFKLGKSIFQRLSGRRLLRLYSLTPQAKVKARFGFKATAINVFNKQFDRVFTDSFNFALSTAK